MEKEDEERQKYVVYLYAWYCEPINSCIWGLSSKPEVEGYQTIVTLETNELERIEDHELTDIVEEFVTLLDIWEIYS